MDFHAVCVSLFRVQTDAALIARVNALAKKQMKGKCVCLFFSGNADRPQETRAAIERRWNRVSDGVCTLLWSRASKVQPRPLSCTYGRVECVSALDFIDIIVASV